MQIYILGIPLLEKYPNNILMELFPAKLGRSLLADFTPADEALKEAQVEPLAKLATLLGKDCEKAGKTLDFICPATEFAVKKKKTMIKESDKNNKKDQEKAPESYLSAWQSGASFYGEKQKEIWWL